MNIRRGMFRLWLVFSVLFIGVVGFANFEKIRNEFYRTYDERWVSSSGSKLPLPVRCSEARGSKADYKKDERDLCWYEFPSFRKLWLEYNDLGDTELAKKLYAKADYEIEFPTRQPWKRVGETVVIAFSVPACFLLAGVFIGWIFAGFRSQRP